MILELRDIHKSFSEVQVLHGISFKITSGKALGFLGRNGAGKTTTIRILMGLFGANQGEILLDGRPFNAREHSIGYLPEERGLYPKEKIIDQLIYFGQLRGLARGEARENGDYWLERLGIEEYRDKKLETLSKGNQQKVQLAETLLCHPDIVILDEPFSGLDPVNAQILRDIIQDLISQDKLVIFSSHQMAYVEEFCQEIALIHQGSIVLEGDLKEIKKEYGRDRMVLTSPSQNPSDLARLLGQIEDIEIMDNKRDSLLIQLLGNKSKNKLLQEIIDLDIDIEKFSMYEPALTDIFVEKVGEN